MLWLLVLLTQARADGMECASRVVDGEDHGCVCQFTERDHRECREGLTARCDEISACWYGGSPSRMLFETAARGDVETAKPLLTPLAGAALQQAGTPMLRVAAFVGQAEMVQLLLEAGVSPDFDDGASSTPLNLALRMQPHRTPIVSLLLDHEADPDKPEPNAALTPLIKACYSGDLAGARLLLSHGADPNARTRHTQNTPLMGAAVRGNLELIALLIAAGADPKQRNAQGMSAAQIAAEHDQARAAELLDPTRN